MGKAWLSVGCMLLLAGCQLLAPKPPPVGPARFDWEKKLCETRGGRFAPGPGGGGYFCFRTPSDAGKMCRRASDCSTACLAQSRTCAPISPLLGCQKILQDDGSTVTQCVN